MILTFNTFNSFIKTWRIQNNGVDAWPQDCVLQMIGTTTQMDCLRRLELFAKSFLTI